jgi:hypothetical protein
MADRIAHIPPPPKRDDAGHQEDVKYSHLLAKNVDESDIPLGYFRSVRFIGTMVSMSLTVISSYFGFAVPANVLTYINLDIGMIISNLFSSYYLTLAGG